MVSLLAKISSLAKVGGGEGESSYYRHVIYLFSMGEKRRVQIGKKNQHCVCMMSGLSSLDLFSGIGGLTHALRGLGIVPIGYVERDPRAQEVLKARMASGDLPEAPLYDDVRDLDGRQFLGRVHIMMGGTPCQGFSHAGNGQGLDHSQSKLFEEFARLAMEIRPRCLFLENVGAVRFRGMSVMLKKLRALGYQLHWITLSACAAGSPQQRRRWYCLGVLEGTDECTTLHSDGTWTPHDWSREPVPRMAPVSEPGRSILLGNSVVPDAVRAAFLLLWTGLSESYPSITQKTRWTMTRPAHRRPCSKMPACGTLMDAEIEKCEVPQGIVTRPAPSSKIILDPACVEKIGKRCVLQKHERLEEEKILYGWATPRHSKTSVSQVLTRRTAQDLPTQLRFEKMTPHASRGQFPNPEWVEHLMGFPRGWTRAAAADVAPAARPGRTRRRPPRQSGPVGEPEPVEAAA